jgi:hypothetical protein
MRRREDRAAPSTFCQSACLCTNPRAIQSEVEGRMTILLGEPMLQEDADLGTAQAGRIGRRQRWM